MSKNVTKSMAQQAAEKLSQKAYGKILEDARSSLHDRVDSIVRKYIPKPVFDVFAEFGDSLSSTTLVNFYYEREDGFSTYLHEQTTFEHVALSYIRLSDADFEALKTARNNFDRAYIASSTYRKQVTDALFALRTERRIAENFPEALPFLNFSGSTELAYDYKDLRSMLH